VLVGRPVVWGLAADGAAGVVAALRALNDDLAHVMALAGAASVDGLDRSLVAGANTLPSPGPTPGPAGSGRGRG